MMVKNSQCLVWDVVPIVLQVSKIYDLYFCFIDKIYEEASSAKYCHFQIIKNSAVFCQVVDCHYNKQIC